MNGLHPPSEALAGASETVLARVTALYAGAGPGSLGLKHIADDLGLQREVRKPRKKIRCATAALHHAAAAAGLKLCPGGLSSLPMALCLLSTVKLPTSCSAQIAVPAS